MTPQCVVCGKVPEELDEYSPEYTGEDLTATEYLIQEEGTYNESNGHFYCTPDYIKVGQPLGVAP